MIKKLTLILILLASCSIPTLSVQTGKVDYWSNFYSFKKGDELRFLNQANDSFNSYFISTSQNEKKYYLQNATKYYFLLKKIAPNSNYATVGLARIYDEMKLDDLAKKYFCDAINLDAKNPSTNYYFALFYFKRKDYIKSLYFAKIAHSSGWKDNYELNYMLGVIYEKLADLNLSNYYYQCAFKQNSSQDLYNKIQSIDALNYTKYN